MPWIEKPELLQELREVEVTVKEGIFSEAGELISFSAMVKNSKSERRFFAIAEDATEEDLTTFHVWLAQRRNELENLKRADALISECYPADGGAR